MFVCYLDDSGKDPQNTLTSLSGYIAKDDDWASFEIDVERWFEEFGVRTLHAKELHSTKGEYSDSASWTVLRKQAFVARICQSMSRHVSLGLSMAASKSDYEAAAKMAKQADRRRVVVTPYSFCFNAIADWVLRDIGIGRMVHSGGVAFVLEAGHEHNPEVERLFHDVREANGLADVFRSISFVPKESSRAIQVADLLAFYARRTSEAVAKKRKPDEHTRAMMNLIGGAVPIRSFMADGFYDMPPAYEVEHAPSALTQPSTRKDGR